MASAEILTLEPNVACIPPSHQAGPVRAPDGHLRGGHDLLHTGAAQPTTGKVIAELKFKFWETMFTGRFDARLWNPHMRNVLPFIEPALTVQQARMRIRVDLESLRGLRNRIAHHEPIFARSLANDLQKAHELIGFRCVHTAAWMHANESASVLIAAKPP